MKKELLVLAAMAAAALAVGWTLRELRTDHSPPLAATAPALPAEVDLAALRKIVEEKSALIFDARPASFYHKAHVPGAVSLPKPDFDRDGENHPALKGIPHDRQIVVYCSSLLCHDSGFVAQGLGNLGYSKVSIFKGGWHAWLDAGYAFESAP